MTFSVFDADVGMIAAAHSISSLRGRSPVYWMMKT